jgi:hypothetical protein
MMRLVPVVVSLVVAAAFTGGAADARSVRLRPPTTRPPAAAVDVGAELAAAIRSKNGNRVAKLLGESVQNYGIWFADPACAKQFGAPGVVTGPELAAFARCLTGLRLQATTRQPGASDNAILTYDPGIELEISHSGGRVRWLGFLYQTAADRGRPTLTAQAFEALRKAGKTNLDDVVGTKLEPVLERSKDTSVSAWVKLCIDDEGSIDHVDVRQTDAPAGQSGKVRMAFEVAIERGWRFRPFTVRGKAMPVCTMALLTYPAARAPLVETLPPALQPSFALGAEAKDDLDGVEGGDEGGLDGSVVGVVGGIGAVPPSVSVWQPVPPTLLEANRLRGDKDIEPDAPTKAQIAKSGKDRLIGSYKLCIDTQGAVATVTLLKSTGFSDYDAKLRREMQQWAYRPYVINGKATPVCSAATFIYSPPTPLAKPKKP